MFNPSHVPNIHLSDISHNPYSRARRAKEDTDSDFESDDSYYQDRDDRGVGRRDYDYEDTRRDLPEAEAVFFRREQDDLEIAHIERRVAEATRALEDAERDLRETKMRIRDRRREERQQSKERSRFNHSVPEFVRPSVDDVHERASQQRMRGYLSPAGNKSRPPTPQPQLSSSLPSRSRSPSPYRFISRLESEIPTLPSRSVKSRSRSRTPNPTVRKGEGSEAVSASQEQVYQSFSKIHDLAKDFQILKQNFVYPSVIEFQKPGSQVGEIITIRARSPPADDESMSDVAYESEDRRPEGKLAYTRTNEALHTYSYAMEKLLGKLDSVDSWNETSVRTKRRGIIGEIEQEASRLERYRQKVWRDYCAQRNAL